MDNGHRNIEIYIILSVSRLTLYFYFYIAVLCETQPWEM